MSGGGRERIGREVVREKRGKEGSQGKEVRRVRVGGEEGTLRDRDRCMWSYIPSKSPDEACHLCELSAAPSHPASPAHTAPSSQYASDARLTPMLLITPVHSATMRS